MVRILRTPALVVRGGWGVPRRWWLVCWGWSRWRTPGSWAGSGSPRTEWTPSWWRRGRRGTRSSGWSWSLEQDWGEISCDLTVTSHLRTSVYWPPLWSAPALCLVQFQSGKRKRNLLISLSRSLFTLAKMAMPRTPLGDLQTTLAATL